MRAILGRMWSLALVVTLGQASPPAVAPRGAVAPSPTEPDAPTPPVPLPPVSPPPDASGAAAPRDAGNRGPIAGQLAVAYEGRTWSRQRRWLSSVQVAGGIATGFGLTANLTVAPTSPYFTTLQHRASSTTVAARLHQLPITAELGYLHQFARVGLEAVAAGGVVVQHLSTTTIPFDTDGTAPLRVQGEWYSDGVLGAHAGLRVHITPRFALRFRAGVELLVRGVTPVVQFADGAQTTAAAVADPERVRGVFSLGFSLRP